MPNNWPYKSDADLREAGYRYDRTERCKGKTCGQEIEFWFTPKGKRMPINPGTMDPHFATCPDVESFRR